LPDLGGTVVRSPADFGALVPKKSRSGKVVKFSGMKLERNRAPSTSQGLGGERAQLAAVEMLSQYRVVGEQ